jgi:hypothetical protein
MVLGNEAHVACGVVLVVVAFKQVSLDSVLEALITKVGVELVEGVEPPGHVLWAGEIEITAEGSEYK